MAEKLLFTGKTHNTNGRNGTAPEEPFRYLDKAIMAMIGRNAAVAQVGEHRHELQGPFAFAAWLGVHAALNLGLLISVLKLGTYLSVPPFHRDNTG
jgi:NADH dehydrogenase FAD-containing subunit